MVLQMLNDAKSLTIFLLALIIFVAVKVLQKKNI